MSNRAVSQAYRSIIDDVIASVRPDFEDMGIEEAVLQELQRSWELKVVASRVTDFGNGTAGPSTRTTVKTEPADGGLILPGSTKQANGASDGVGDASRAPDEGAPSPSAESKGDGAISEKGGVKEENAKAEDKPDQGSGSNEKEKEKKLRPVSNSDEIGSDLDDSDEEDLAGGGVGNEDIVLCLYDKVQRVKNKWKCVLKDGIASVGGRDYLFSKCNGEFEW